jgi:hypothetical protein
MVYNLTQITANSTGMLGFVQGVNEVLLFGWLGILLLIGIMVVMFTSFMFTTQNDVAKSLSATAYIGFILSLLLYAVDLITNPLAIFLTLIMSAATIAFTWKS